MVTDKSGICIFCPISLFFLFPLLIIYFLFFSFLIIYFIYCLFSVLWLFITCSVCIMFLMIWCIYIEGLQNIFCRPFFHLCVFAFDPLTPVLMKKSFWSINHIPTGLQLWLLKECLYHICIITLLLIISLNSILSADYSAHSSSPVRKARPRTELSEGLQLDQRKTHPAVSVCTHSYSSCSSDSSRTGHHPPHQGPRQKREVPHSFPRHRYKIVSFSGADDTTGASECVGACLSRRGGGPEGRGRRRKRRQTGRVASQCHKTHTVSSALGGYCFSSGGRRRQQLWFRLWLRGYRGWGGRGSSSGGARHGAAPPTAWPWPLRGDGEGDTLCTRVCWSGLPRLLWPRSPNI